MDLFDRGSKKEQLVRWMRVRHYFSTADVVRWGVDNFYLRAKRTVRDIATEVDINNPPRVRKLSKDECLFRGFKGRMGWYEYTGRGV